MKVIGTGSPHVLTISFERCELEGLREELHRRRADVTEAAAVAHKRSQPDTGAGSTAVEVPHQELVEVSRLMNKLDLIDIDEAEVVELVGPSWVWARVVRHAFDSAIAGLTDASERFRDPEGRCRPDELRAAAAAASAWTETMLGFHHVDNHGMDRW